MIGRTSGLGRICAFKAQFPQIQRASTKASITRTGFFSSTQLSRHSGKSVDCPRSDPATNPVIDFPADSAAESLQEPGF
jgi:hypothetical protein